MQDLAYSRVQPKSVLTFCIRRAKERRDIGAIRGPFDLKILSAFTLVGSFLARSAALLGVDEFVQSGTHGSSMQFGLGARRYRDLRRLSIIEPTWQPRFALRQDV